MEPFFPFIYEAPKKDAFEQIPLYVELNPPYSEPPKEEEEEPRVIIFEL